MTSTSNGTGKVTIVTHNGPFHADDIFAVATLSLFLENDHDITITRSRDPNAVANADYVVDVGLEYDEIKNRFDHHQEGGAGKRENGIPYASFGLVWKKFGGSLSKSEEVFNKIDKVLIQWIDSADNGVQVIESKIKDVFPYDIGLFFNTFTPGWKDLNINIDEVFNEVVDIAKYILKREISKRQDLLEAKAIVKDIYDRTQDKRLIIMDKFYPSRELLSTLPEPLFTVFPRDDGDWALKTIRIDDNNFVSKKDLPKAWGGKKDKDLEEVTGIPGSVFCHKGLFMAVNKTKEGILKMAEIALNS